MKPSEVPMQFSPDVPQIPPLRSQYASDPVIAELLSIYLDELQETADSIMAAFAESDLSEIQRLVHQVRGSAGAYGYPSITQLAGQIDDTIRIGAEFESIKPLTNELLGWCQAAIKGGAA
jgi:two-component system, sensor histidine kinase LadS